MFVGGFLLADASNLDLMAQIGDGVGRKDNRVSVTPFPGATAQACKVEFKKAEDEYKIAVRAAKDKRDLAVRAKNLCIQKINEARKSVSPRPSSTPIRTPTATP